MKLFPFLLRALPGLAAGLLPASQARAQYVYVGDYAGNQVVRFDPVTGNEITPSPYISVPGPEGIGGATNRLAVSNAFGTVRIYDTSTGAAQNPPQLSEINTGGLAFRIAFTPDTQNIYAAVANEVRLYNIATGTLLNSALGDYDVWGEAVNPLTHEVYYTTGWDTNGAYGNVYKADANLNNRTLVVNGSIGGIAGLRSAAGITFLADGSFYVVSGAATPGNDFINHYRADGTFIDRVDTTGLPAGALDNAFDAEIGPNGNLYVTSASGACAIQFNTSNDTYNSIFVPPHTGGIASAKTIHFSSNNVGAVPEPGSIALLVGMTAVGAGFLRRRVRVRACAGLQ